MAGAVGSLAYIFSRRAFRMPAVSTVLPLILANRFSHESGVKKEAPFRREERHVVLRP
jgi:hypothetical protein